MCQHRPRQCRHIGNIALHANVVFGRRYVTARKMRVERNRRVAARNERFRDSATEETAATSNECAHPGVP
jgi:hypothetical protein